jgi:excisionase family DNA binding protein
VAPSRVALSEAAERLGVHYTTVYRYVRTGRLAAERHGARWSVSLVDLNSMVLSNPRTARSGTTLHRRTRLRDRLTQGDGAGAWSVIEEALTSGSEPTFICSELLLPSMKIIGDEWEAGTRSIAEEHRASEITSRLIGRLGPRFARRGPSRGTVVLGLAPGELHSLGAAVLSDFLRRAGYEPINLGANTPAASFVEMAHGADRLIAVLVGATTSGRDDAIGDVVGALRRARLSTPILVGGRAVHDDEHAMSLGADGWSGHHALDAVARVELLGDDKEQRVVSRRTKSRK